MRNPPLYEHSRLFENTFNFLSWKPCLMQLSYSFVEDLLLFFRWLMSDILDSCHWVFWFSFFHKDFMTSRSTSHKISLEKNTDSIFSHSLWCLDYLDSWPFSDWVMSQLFGPYFLEIFLHEEDRIFSAMKMGNTFSNTDSLSSACWSLQMKSSQMLVAIY